jgi:hypothetical protein
MNVQNPPTLCITLPRFTVFLAGSVVSFAQSFVSDFRTKPDDYTV